MLGLNDIIPSGKFNGKRVGDVLTANRKNIWHLIVNDKFDLDDDVLTAAHIKKTVSNVTVESVVLDRPHVKQQTLAKKDTKAMADELIKELNVIENSVGEYKEDDVLVPITEETSETIADGENDD